jgi:two-component system sensor histidine kinase VicK
VDLSVQAEATARMLAPLAESGGITILLDLGENCVARCGREDAIQILRNLMENAIKYNLPNGQVEVTTTRQEDWVHVDVMDTGVGIPEEDLPRIFERFYRVDKARSRESGGTGLGLSIAKEIIAQHKGTIGVVDTDEPGLTVRITLWIEGPDHG